MAKKTVDEMRAALDDDLNTAQALGAIFDMVRDVNAAADAGEVRKGDVPALLKALEQFDEIFAVLKDDDAAKIRRSVEWAKAEGLQRQDQPGNPASWPKPRRSPMRKSKQLVAKHSRPARRKDFKHAPTPSASNSARKASFWRTPRTACAGRESKRQLAIAVAPGSGLRLA